MPEGLDWRRRSGCETAPAKEISDRCIDDIKDLRQREPMSGSHRRHVFLNTTPELCRNLCNAIGWFSTSGTITTLVPPGNTEITGTYGDLIAWRSPHIKNTASRQAG